MRVSALGAGCNAASREWREREVREKSAQLALAHSSGHTTTPPTFNWSATAWVFKAALVWTRWAQGAMEQDQGWLAENLQVRPC